MGDIDFATKQEIAEVRQAIRDLYQLEQRFKSASFDRSPMPALQRILVGQEPPSDVLEGD